MAYDKVVDSAALDALLGDIGDAIREKTGGTELIPAEDMPGEIKGIETYKSLMFSVFDRSVVTLLLPEGISAIGKYAFWSCTKMVYAEIPKSVEVIEQMAFRSCTSLESVTFLFKKTKGISVDCFNDCKNLTTIRAPWSEGAVSGAPWGATNATIIYNYTGEE